jgi:hypothetical protein
MKFKVMTAIFALALVAGFAALTLSLRPGVVSADSAASVVGTINGGGTAIMTDLPPGLGVSSFGFEVTLFSDGSARGFFDCVDHMGDVPGYPGNVFGDITSWTRDAGGVHLHVTGKFVTIPGSLTGGVVPVTFTVTIQQSGGAGVGQWTLDAPPAKSHNGGPICQELLISGQIVERWNYVAHERKTSLPGTSSPMRPLLPQVETPGETVVGGLCLSARGQIGVSVPAPPAHARAARRPGNLSMATLTATGPELGKHPGGRPPGRGNCRSDPLIIARQAR